MMTFGEFKKHVDVYSADFSYWPLDKVKPALALVEQSADVRAYFDEALRLDAILRTYRTPEIVDTSALEDKILSSLKEPFTEPVLPRRTVFVAAPLGGMLVVALMVGFLFGAQPAPQNEELVDTAFYAPQFVVAGNMQGIEMVSYDSK